MGRLTNIGISRLDVLVSEHGEAGVLEMVVSRVAEGESLSGISRSFGMPYSVLWRWLGAAEGEGDNRVDRMEAYRSALEARADALAHEAMRIAGTPQMGEKERVLADGGVEVTREDMLGHRKLQVDTLLKLAGKWDRKTYGEGKDAGGGAGITVVVQRGAGPVRVEDGRGGVLRIGEVEGQGDLGVDTAAERVIDGDDGCPD